MENITQNDTSQNILYLLIVSQQGSLPYDALYLMMLFNGCLHLKQALSTIRGGDVQRAT